MFRFFKNLLSIPKFNPSISVNKWVSKVSGRPKDIEKALKHLNHEPINADELAKIVRDQRRESLTEDLKAAREAHSNNFY
jgi:hypothetical protein